MKITSVDVMIVDAGAPANRASCKPVFCRIHTDEGLYGDGEAGLMMMTGRSAAFGMLRELAALIVGKDPIENQIIVEKLKESYLAHSGGPVFFAALAAIDVALWDIRGKFFNVPVYKLLGGKHTDSLRCYASQINYGWGSIQQDAVTLDDYVARAKEAMAQGYDAVKADFFENDDQGNYIPIKARRGVLPDRYLRLIEERVATVRETIGPDKDILMECHGYTDTTSFMQIAERVKKYSIMYFEEPNTANPQTYARLQGHPDVRIAAGERIHTRRAFIPYITEQLIQVAQPDLGNCGGISEGLKIADLAAEFDIGMQYHCANSPICTAATLQLEAAIPNFLIHEHCCMQERDYVRKLAKYDYQPENGRMTIPELPGIGNELSEYSLSTCEKVVVK